MSKILTLFTIMLFSVNTSLVYASDHVDGAITINNAVADLTDLFVFPSPEKPGHLVLIMNSYPFVPESGHFSDRLMYSFIIRHAVKSGAGLTSAFLTDSSDYRIDCIFEVPHEKNKHSVICTTIDGYKLQAAVDKPLLGPESRIKIFAGKRSDPFLLNATWFGRVVFDRLIPLANTSNDMTRLNVLSIALELDVGHIDKLKNGSLFAVAAEISLLKPKNNVKVIIDRLGRPEITNTHIVASTQQDDLRDTYNKESPFHIEPTNLALYKKRLVENIEYYDSLDGHIDWLPDWKEVLTNILVNDYLLIDMSKPFTTQAYFDIEHSMLRSQPNTRSGGRVPGEHVIDTLFTTLVNGGHASGIHDGIPINMGLPSDTFPYLAPASTGIIAQIKAYLTARASKPLLLKKRPE